MAHHLLDLQIASASRQLPKVETVQYWLDTVLSDFKDTLEVVLRIVDVDEMTSLNQTYRQKQGATNILSFPFDAPVGVELNLLGDLVVCAPVVEQEAEQQGKLLEHHWAHIFVHGIFHLLGYDHIDDLEAEEMEALEIAVLQRLHITNPYQEH